MTVPLTTNRQDSRQALRLRQVLRGFGAVLGRDVHVTGQELPSFLAQTLIQPFFFLFIFAKVLTAGGRELFDGMWVFVSFRVVLPGPLAEVTPVVSGSRVPGRGCCRRVLSVVGSSVCGVIRAFLFALDPTDAQAEAFRSHCGGQRFAYNWGLALVWANLDQRAAERTYGIGEDQLTEPVDWSAYSLRRAWNEAKDARAPWWAQNSKEAYASGLANLATALRNWSSSRSGARAGPRVGSPRFKSRRARLSCRFTTGAFGLGADRRHVQLPRIGQVRTHESTRTLARKAETGTARIRSATLSWQRGRWHVAFSVELPDPTPPERTGGRVVGVKAVDGVSRSWPRRRPPRAAGP